MCTPHFEIQNGVLAKCRMSGEENVTVTIPDGVTSIGKDACFDCGLLQSINVSEGNSNYLSCGGVLFDKSKSVAVKFIAKRYIVTDVIDWFGKDIKFSDATDDEVTVTVKVNPIAMKMWALKYSKHIKVIFPQSLVDEIKADIDFDKKNYE